MKKQILSLMVLTLIFSCRPRLGEGVYADNKIIGGIETDRHPGVVALTDSESGQYCSGIAISPTIVITAAHCLQKNDGSFHQTSTLKVYVGSGDGEESYQGQYSVREFYIHSDYDYTLDVTDRFYDFGYLVLETALELKEYMVPLTDQRTIKKIFGKDRTHQKVILMGYGTNEELVSGIKRATDTYMIEVSEHEFKNSSMEKGDYFWSNSKEKGSCHGDSGGPALIVNDRKLYVIGVSHSAVSKYGDGITSNLFAISCQAFNKYGRIDIFMEWFLETEHGDLYKEYLASL